MANRTVKDAHTVKGTNPQYLIEKIIRTRIYECKYWKEECFGLSAELLVDKAMELKYIGGIFAGNVKPTPFLCLILKMLQIQPEKEIIVEFIKTEEFKYVRALGAFYMRLTGSSLDCYKYLEPLYNDYRKLKQMDKNGVFSILHMDELIDNLLMMDRFCDVILPRIQKRHILEEENQIDMRVSALEDDLDDEEYEEEYAALMNQPMEEDERESPPSPRIPRRSRSRSPHRRRSRSRSKHRHRSRSKDRERRHRDKGDEERKHRRKHHHKEKDKDKKKKDKEEVGSKDSKQHEIDEANAIRKKLGIPLLRVYDDLVKQKSSKKSSFVPIVRKKVLDNDQVQFQVLNTQSEMPARPDAIVKLNAQTAAIPSSVVKDQTSPWLCALCGKKGHENRLGDLFGPYLTSQSHEGDDSRRTELWVHQDCIVWAQDVFLFGSKIYGLVEAVQDAWETLCSRCELSGATICCAEKRCKLQFHFFCAKLEHCKFDEERFTVLCPKHCGKKSKSS